MEDKGPATPFGRSYPDPRDDRSRDSERVEVRKQVGHLVRLRREPAYLTEFLRALQARREGTAAVGIEPVAAGKDGSPVCVAPLSFLVRRESLRNREASLRKGFGFAVVDDDPRSGVVRLEVEPRSGRAARRSAAAPSTPDVATELRGNGFDVGLNHIVPLGPIMKAEGGPEPSAGARPFPAVQIDAEGPGPVVAVIDTGISVEQRGDGYLDGLVRPDNVDPLDAYPVPPGPDGFLDAAAGHGSFVAGVVAQVAPTARLRIYKVTDSDGVCTDEQVAAAIRRAVQEGAQIVNLSLGTSTTDGNPPTAMLDAIGAVPPDVLVVAAAGNDGDEVPVWPAAFAPTGPGPTFPNVVSVAGLDPDGGRNDWSSHGSWVTCSAIGEGVVSTYVIGTEDGALIRDDDPDTYGPDSWATWTGTSFAAPQIAGGVARLCHEKGVPPLEALELLLNGAPDDGAGWGRRVRILPGT